MQISTQKSSQKSSKELLTSNFLVQGSLGYGEDFDSEIDQFQERTVKKSSQDNKKQGQRQTSRSSLKKGKLF